MGSARSAATPEGFGAELRLESRHGADRPARETSRSRAWGSWVLACVIGELAGFGATAAIALVLLERFGRPETLRGRFVALAVMTTAGALEGASLGSAQAFVLDRLGLRISRRRWVGVTASLAAAGWFVGMLGPLIAHARGAQPTTAGQAPGPAAILAMAMVFGMIAGVAFGFVQGRVLRVCDVRLRTWIVANACGWGLGLPWAYLAGKLGGGAAEPIATMAIALAGAAAMGLALGAVTGLPVAVAATRDRPG